jgi:hypothetical protein
MIASSTKNIPFLLIVLLFCSGAYAKTPAPRRHIYASAQKEGIIGVTAAIPMDNPADNLFHVYLQSPLKGNERVWLTYDLDGVHDYTAVSRSINDQLSAGGYFVKKRQGRDV